MVPVAGNGGERVEDGTASTLLGGNDNGGHEHRAPGTRRTKGGNKRPQLREETSKPRKSPQRKRPRKLD